MWKWWLYFVWFKWTKQIIRHHLLLHQVFELCDLVCVFGVAGDVLLIKESLSHRKTNRLCKSIIIKSPNNLLLCPLCSFWSFLALAFYSFNSICSVQLFLTLPLQGAVSIKFTHLSTFDRSATLCLNTSVRWKPVAVLFAHSVSLTFHIWFKCDLMNVCPTSWYLAMPPLTAASMTPFSVMLSRLMLPCSCLCWYWLIRVRSSWFLFSTTEMAFSSGLTSTWQREREESPSSSHCAGKQHRFIILHHVPGFMNYKTGSL